MHGYCCPSEEPCTALTKEMKAEPVWRAEQMQEKRPVGACCFTTAGRGSH